MTRTIDFRYVVVRGAADFCEISPAEGGEPTIRMDKDAEIKMSLSGTFIPDDRVDWLTDRIRAEMILDGVTYPLGIFLPATVRTNFQDGVRSEAIEAYDQCWLMRDTRKESTVMIPSGTKYIAAVQQLLLDAGVALNLATPSTAVISEDRTWDIGTDHLTIANELLTEINYKPVWFNAQGMAVLEPQSAPSAENIQHTLDEGDVRSMLLPQMTREADIYQAPNVFVVSVGNPDKGTNMTATAVNDYVNSPLSVQRRGRRIVKFIKLNNIAGQTQLQRYADLQVRLSMYVAETVEIVTGLLPGYGVADIVALNMAGVFSVCVEQSWEMHLATGGDMRHTLERVVYQYGSS